MIKSCANCICTHSWNGCGRFDVDTYCNWWKDMFAKGRTVEIENDLYRFSLKGKLTNNYARGIIQEVNEDDIIVKLFCNGEICSVKREWLLLK